MSAPTLREMDISLSFRMITMRRLRLPDVVERLERHAARERRVADDGHHLVGRRPRRSRAFARPSATDSESEAWPEGCTS